MAREDIHGPIPHSRGVTPARCWCHLCAKYLDYSKLDSPGVTENDLTCEIQKSLRNQQHYKWPEQWYLLEGALMCKEFVIDWGKQREERWQKYTHMRAGRPEPCYRCEYSRCRTSPTLKLPAMNYATVWRCAHPKNRHPDRYPEVRFEVVGKRTEVVCDVGYPRNMLSVYERHF